jgi:hypothetical protein
LYNFVHLKKKKKPFGKASSGSLPENGSRAGFWNFTLFETFRQWTEAKKDMVSVIN